MAGDEGPTSTSDATTGSDADDAVRPPIPGEVVPTRFPACRPPRRPACEASAVDRRARAEAVDRRPGGARRRRSRPAHRTEAARRGPQAWAAGAGARSQKTAPRPRTRTPRTPAKSDERDVSDKPATAPDAAAVRRGIGGRRAGRALRTAARPRRRSRPRRAAVPPPRSRWTRPRSTSRARRHRARPPAARRRTASKSDTTRDGTAVKPKPATTRRRAAPKSDRIVRACDRAATATATAASAAAPREVSRRRPGGVHRRSVVAACRRWS